MNRSTIRRSKQFTSIPASFPIPDELIADERGRNRNAATFAASSV